MLKPKNELEPRLVEDCHDLEGDVLAIDFETFYEDDYSLRKMTYRNYICHPKFDAYVMSVVSDTTAWVGHPKNFDWNVTRGKELVSFNATFDRSVYEFGLGAPGDWPMKSWVCCLAACHFLNIRGNLAQVMDKMFGISVSKEVRAKAEGVDFSKLDELPEDMKQYVLLDSVYALAIWYEVRNLWPNRERACWSFTTDMALRGIPSNRKWLECALKRLKERVDYYESQIPLSKKQSRNELIAYCKEHGIEPPVTTAKTNPLWHEWLDTWGKDVPWISCLAKQRSANRLLSIYTTALNCLYTDEEGVDRIPFTFKYCGAGTGRWTSGGKGSLNAQQFNREPVEGINTRHILQAGKGYRLVVADYAAIEVRVLMSLAGQTEIFEFLKTSPDLYEAFAKFLGQMPKEAIEKGWSLKQYCKEKDSPLRHHLKCQLLGCGFGLAAKGLHKQNPSIPLERCEELVAEYREKCPKVIALWKKLETVLRNGCASPSKQFGITLPSGRKIWYRGIHRKLIVPKDKERKPFMAWVADFPDEDGKPGDTILSVPTLINNLVQGTARDLMVSSMVKAGLMEDCELVLLVHDEAVLRCRKEKAEEVAKALEEIMIDVPEWGKNIPLSAPADILYNYRKD